MGANTTPQAVFGPGNLWLTRTDVSNPTPFNIGKINEFSLDYSFETKELSGQKQFPLLVARSTGKITGKMKPALVSGRAMNTALFGGTFTSGKMYDISTTSATVDSTAYTITVTPPDSGMFDNDLGVSQNGVALDYVESDPSDGEYTLSTTGSTATYTFGSAMAGESVDLSYAYYETGSDGQSMIITNEDIGTTPTFQIDYKTTLYGSTYFIRMFSAVGTKGSNSFKINDYMMPEYDFSIFANASDQIGIISLATRG